MNEMITALHEEIAESEVLPITYVAQVYNNTSEGSILRKFLMRSIARLIDPEMLEDVDGQGWPEETWMDFSRSTMAHRFASSIPTREPYKLINVCSDSHVHGEGTWCT